MPDHTNEKPRHGAWSTVKRVAVTVTSAVAGALAAFGRNTASVFRPSLVGKEAFEARLTRASTRDRAKNSSRSSTARCLWAVGILLASMLMCASALWLGSLWKIGEVTVEGHSLYAAEAICQRSGLITGREYLGVDSWTAERRIRRAFPLVEDVKVTKHLNGSVTVTVTEYTDLYYTRHNENYYIIAAKDRQVLQVSAGSTLYREMGATYIGLPSEAHVRVGEALSYAYLPYQSGEAETLYDTRAEDANEEFAYVWDAVNTVMSWTLADRVTGMELSDRYAMYIILDGRIKVTVGKGKDLARQLDRAARILEEELPDGNLPVILNVSDPTSASIREDSTLDLPAWAQNLPSTSPDS